MIMSSLYLKHVPNLRFEHLVYHSLISCTKVFEAEGHYSVTVITLVGHKCGFLLVCGMHGCFIIYQLINIGQGEGILRTSLIEISIINVNPTFSIRFLS